MPPRLVTIVSRPFEENTYIVGPADRPEVFVVDPGTEPDLILERLADDGLTPVAIVNTHGHLDHIAGNEALKQAFPDVPILIGAGDAAMLTDPELNLSAGYGFAIVSPPADRTLADGERIELAGLTWDVWEVPGHSPGHVVFYSGELGLVLGGDVLFRGSVGRTDFPGGSFEQLRDGIRRRLWPLPAATVVYPGHGPVTTIGQEKRFNPFVGDAAPER